MMTPKTNREVQRDFVARQRKRGMIKLQKWVTQEQAAAIEKILKEWKK